MLEADNYGAGGRVAGAPIGFVSAYAAMAVTRGDALGLAKSQAQ